MSELKAEIDAMLETEDNALKKAVTDTQNDFLDNYNRHMSFIYSELQRFKRLSGNNTFMTRKDIKVAKLTKDNEFIQDNALILAKDCDQFKTENKKLMKKNDELMNEKVLLVSTARRYKTLNKQLECVLRDSND
jgi:hypothetical protein